MKKITIVDTYKERLDNYLNSLNLPENIFGMIEYVADPFSNINYLDSAIILAHEEFDRDFINNLKKECGQYSIPLVLYSGGTISSNITYDEGNLIAYLRFSDIFNRNLYSFINYFCDKQIIQLQILLYGDNWKKHLLIEFRNNIKKWLSINEGEEFIMKEDLQKFLPVGLQNSLDEPFNSEINTLVEDDIYEGACEILNKLCGNLLDTINKL